MESSTGAGDDQPSPTSFPTKDARQEETSNNQQTGSILEWLSDEILLDLISKFASDPKTLSNLSGVNKQFREMVTADAFVEAVVNKEVDPDHKELFAPNSGCSAYEKLAFYQAVVEQGLFEDNRIGFDFASTDIDNDNGSASQIPNSQRRIHAVGTILEQFENANCIIEAHCGTAAPPGIAPDFSRSRGAVVESEIVHSDFAITNVSERFTMNPWGRRIAQRATQSEHEYGIIARQGRGWVEVYLTLGEMELPKRPEYYEGAQMNDNEEAIIFRILW